MFLALGFFLGVVTGVSISIAIWVAVRGGKHVGGA